MAACFRCGDQFLLGRGRKHCPRPDCRRAARALATRLHVGAQRVRDAGFGAAVEKFTVRDVYERDNGSCYLCGRPTLADLDDGMQAASATIDHVVPIDQGGAHTLDNVRLAHLHCNQVKGRRTPEDARAALAARDPVPMPVQAPAMPAVPLGPFAQALASRLKDVPRERPGGRPLITAMQAEPARNDEPAPDE